MLRHTRFTLSYMCTDGCFVQTCPNTGAVFGRTNNTFGGTLSYVLHYFPHQISNALRFMFETVFNAHGLQDAISTV